MKIYIPEFQVSLDFNPEVLSLVQSHIAVTKDLITPIGDHRAKLQLNASYLASDSGKFYDFYRIFNAYSVLLGGLLLLSENIYRISKSDSPDLESLSSEQLIASAEFKQFLETEEFQEKMNLIQGFEAKTINQAHSDILRIAKQISKELFNDNIYTNIKIALAMTNTACRAITAPLRIETKWNEKGLQFLIAETQKLVLVNFNGSEDEYELLDNWLSTPELKLPRDASGSKYEVQTTAQFVDWFNGLRSRLESECSYKTILKTLEVLGDEERAKYIKNIQDKITMISAGNSSNIIGTRKKVIEFLHGILNRRKGFAKKEFIEFTMNDLDAGFNKKHDAFILSLYQ